MNCAAVAENLLLADLFGHVRGAYTGAERDRAGVFETAQGGTVFLDEIGDLPLSAQGMLLRVLQESEVRRVGESLARKVKARVVAATHRDLSAMVAAGSFRNDLFFRLKVASVVLPPLAQRMEDVPRLAEHFLTRTRPGLRRAELSSAALAALCRYRWPGNVRELENVLKVAAELAASETGRIEPYHLELPEKVESNEAENGIRDYHRLVDAFRIRLVSEALAAANGNRAEAARRLKLTRQAFSYLVRSLRIP
jgi:transcriptional regulator with GAF, ATPase, and Fis domain